jgi:manganese/zinc/iron transport system permease protein
VLLVVLLYKEFKLTVFDPGFAQAQGWPVWRLDLLLMSLIAVAVVIGLPAVGVVLMAAMLILPAAAARFWTERFGLLLILSALFGMATGVIGTALSSHFDKLPAGPIIVLTGSALFFFSVLFAPRRGAVARALSERRFRRELAAGEILVEKTPPGIAEETADKSAFPDTNHIQSAPTTWPSRKQTSSAVAPDVPSRKTTLASSHLIGIVCTLGISVSLFAWWWQTLDSSDRHLAGWTILIASLANIPCAILGCFLVLRRMSLLGDAISHSVLPGIVLAYFLTQQVSGLPITLGAMGFGILAVLLTHTLHTFGRVPEDSSMGAVYTTLFAAGVILLTRLAGNVHLDVDCVFSGALEYVPADLIDGTDIPRALPSFAFTCLATILFVWVFWKELKIASFDPALATAMGISATLMHYFLMAVVAGVSVTAFEAVGSILVIAMLIVPAATAYMLADRLGSMIACSVVVAILSAVLGYIAAHAGGGMASTNVAGMMAVMAGLQFGLAVLFAPKHGLISKWWRNFALSLRIAGEDVVAMLYRAEEAAERGLRTTTTASAGEARSVTHGLAHFMAIPNLRRRGEIRPSASGGMELTDAGRELARSIVRSHRLWETYLGEETELPLDHLHEPAERMEHFIGRELQEQIAASLPASSVDPHGRAIPEERRDVN